jgi:hypothetical protein
MTWVYWEPKSRMAIRLPPAAVEETSDMDEKGKCGSR